VTQTILTGFGKGNEKFKNIIGHINLRFVSKAKYLTFVTRVIDRVINISIYELQE
jgi:hypothetical protein